MSTAYHPQTDGQTENLNQTLEIALRAYINESMDNWSSLLSGFALSYNTTPHSSTGFTPAFLLCGYHPKTSTDFTSRLSGTKVSVDRTKIAQVYADPEAEQFTKEFQFYRSLAKEAIKLAQAYQEKYYNVGRREVEFEVGDLVLINLHSLQLLRAFKGQGRKLLPRFDGPFEILEKVSKVAYRLRLPASYQGHPVFNINHLELYNKADVSTVDRPKLPSLRKTFEELEEFEVEAILDSKYVKGPNGKRIRKYKVRWKGYDPKFDTWETRRNLKNAPEILRKFEQGTN